MRSDDNDIETGIVQCVRRSDSCPAADDEHVRRSTSSWPGAEQQELC
jgi:hypothetical protein